MQDLTREVAEDLERFTMDEEVDQEARRMQGAPSLETILQRLHEMEVSLNPVKLVSFNVSWFPSALENIDSRKSLFLGIY